MFEEVFVHFMPTRIAALLVLFLSMAPSAHAAETKVPHASHAPLAVRAIFDDGGRLWRVRVADGHLVVDVSEDRGEHFGVPARVMSLPEPVAADGEQRPEIAVGQNNRVYVAWTTPLPELYAGNIRFARSLDGGRTFEAPLTVNDNREAITHRFQSLQVAPDGHITLVWIDKREGEAAKRAGKTYRGAAIYQAVSEDGGVSFRPNVRLAAHSCECCRIALASDSDGQPVAFWRHVFADGSRDHALARVDGRPVAEPLRATTERWQVNACPHHGPDLAVAADGTRHGVWFNQAGGEASLFYGAWNQDGQVRNSALRFAGPGAVHPALLVLGSRLLVAWKAFDGEKTVVNLIASADAGKTWSAPTTVATTPEASDHPRLIAWREQGFLSWSTAREGYRLIPLPDGSAK